MATKKYVSLEKLSLYDEKIKKHIADADAAALQSAKDYADGLAGNYDAAGSANAALTSAKSYTDTEVAKANAAAAAAQADVDALETYVGTIPEGYSENNVVAYVNKKAEETLTSATGGSSESAASVLAALNTYKSENDPKVAANTTAAANAQTAADNAKAAADAAQSHSEGVAADLATEVTNRTNADTALGNRIATLEGQITGLSGAMHFVGVKESVPSDVSDYSAGDVITVGEKEYVFNGTAFVEFGDVSAEGERIKTLEGEMDAVQADLAAEVTNRTNADTALDNRIKTLESAVGESGSVATDIATAKSEAISAAAADATSKDEALETKITDAYKAYADGEDEKIESRVGTLEGASHTHTNKTELDLIVTGDKAKWDDAAGKAHTHENKDVLDGITAGKVSNWDSAEANAKTYADGLNSAMAARMDAVEAWQTNMVEVSEAEINALFTA